MSGPLTDAVIGPLIACLERLSGCTIIHVMRRPSRPQWRGVGGEATLVACLLTMNENCSSGESQRTLCSAHHPIKRE